MRVATATTKQRKQGPRPRPGPRAPSDTRRPWWLAAAAAVIVLVVAGVVLAAFRPGGSSDSIPAQGLPRTSDYHSLLVAPSDPLALVLGTHQGLFRSADGGRTWAKAELDGRDAMNLARPSRSVVWAAGHLVLAKSVDGGATWEDVQPSGLPSLDVHGFAVDPRDPSTVYAAIAGEGLFRSNDGARSFELRSRDVGPGVMALTVLPDGRILAGDMQRRLLASSANGGTDWTGVVQASVMGLAVNPTRPQLVLASGPGVLRSTDGGRTWAQALQLEAGSGPVAWSSSNPDIAYVVGLDRSLWRSDDSGKSWSESVPGGEG